MNIAALIPARGGSKRIPRKNLQKIGDKTLLEISILQARFFTDKIYVSSEDDEIINLAIENNAEPICRPMHYSDDHAIGIDVIHHALQFISAEWIIYLQPTNPLRDIEAIGRALSGFWKSGCKSGLSVYPWNGYMYRKCQCCENINTINHQIDTRRGRTQENEIIYLEDGNFYIFGHDIAKHDDYFWGDPFLFYSRYCIDIDDKDELDAVRKIWNEKEFLPCPINSH